MSVVPACTAKSFLSGPSVLAAFHAATALTPHAAALTILSARSGAINFGRCEKPAANRIELASFINTEKPRAHLIQYALSRRQLIA